MQLLITPAQASPSWCWSAERKTDADARVRTLPQLPVAPGALARGGCQVPVPQILLNPVQIPSRGASILDVPRPRAHRHRNNVNVN